MQSLSLCVQRRQRIVQHPLPGGKIHIGHIEGFQFIVQLFGLRQRGYGAVAFAHCGKALFEVFKYFGVCDIAYNQPKALPYPTENPWA